MGKAELLKQLSKLKKNLKSADPSKKRSTNPYHKAHAINANINEIKGKLANLGHNVNNSNYENNNGHYNHNINYSLEAYRTNEHKEANHNSSKRSTSKNVSNAHKENNHNSSKRRTSKKVSKTRRFKALNRYKAKPKTRRRHR